MKRSIVMDSPAPLMVTGAVPDSTAAIAALHGRTITATDVRVMSFNIHHGADGTGVLDLERTAGEIEASGAQLVGLQEVDNRWSSRSEFVDQAAWLAERLKLHYVYGANLDIKQQEDQTKRSQYGNAILSKYPIISSENHSLRNSDEDARLSIEPRGLLEAVLDVEGKHIAFYSTHLDHQCAQQRELQARKICAITKASNCPIIVVGDFNAQPDAMELQPLFNDFTDTFAALGQNDGYTFTPNVDVPAGSGTVEDACQRIDYILVSKEGQPLAAKVIYTPVSDHLPIVADLRVETSRN